MPGVLYQGLGSHNNRVITTKCVQLNTCKESIIYKCFTNDNLPGPRHTHKREKKRLSQANCQLSRFMTVLIQINHYFQTLKTRIYLGSESDQWSALKIEKQMKTDTHIYLFQILDLAILRRDVQVPQIVELLDDRCSVIETCSA